MNDRYDRYDRYAAGLGLWASLARDSATNKSRAAAEKVPKLSDLPFVDLARVLSPFIAKTIGAQPASGASCNRHVTVM